MAGRSTATRNSTGTTWSPKRYTAKSDKRLVANHQQDEEIKRLNKIYTNLLKNSGCEYIGAHCCTLSVVYSQRPTTEGYGKILDPHTVQVTLPGGTARKLTTKNILIAVGGKATKLNIPGAVRRCCLKSTMVVYSAPRHITCRSMP